MTPAAPTNHGIGEEEIARVLLARLGYTDAEIDDLRDGCGGDGWHCALADARAILANFTLLRHSGNASAGGGASELADAIEREVGRARSYAGPLSQLHVKLRHDRWIEVIAALRTRPASQSAGGVEKLVKRLRSHRVTADEIIEAPGVQLEAADTLEALSREVEALTRRCGELEDGLREIADQPENYRDKDTSYGVGYAFYLVKCRAASLLKGPTDG